MDYTKLFVGRRGYGIRCGGIGNPCYWEGRLPEGLEDFGCSILSALVLIGREEMDLDKGRKEMGGE